MGHTEDRAKAGSGRGTQQPTPPEKRTFALGGLVRPLGEQLPELSKEAADHFDRDRMAISRCFLRDVITYSQAMKAYDRLAKHIHTELKRSVSDGAGNGTASTTDDGQTSGMKTP